MDCTDVRDVARRFEREDARKTVGLVKDPTRDERPVSEPSADAKRNGPPSSSRDRRPR